LTYSLFLVYVVIVVLLVVVVAAICYNYLKSLQKQHRLDSKYTWSLFCPLVTNSFPTLTLGCRSDLSRSVVLTPSRNATFSASVHQSCASSSVRYDTIQYANIQRAFKNDSS